MSRKNRYYLTAGMGLLLAALLLQVCSRMISGFATWYAHYIYPVLVLVIGGFFGLFPFSAVEIGLYLLLFVILVSIIKMIRQPVVLLIRGFFLVSLLLFLYNLNCGVNYHAMSFSEYAGIETGTYSEDELRQLCEYLVQRINETETQKRYADHKSEWIREGVTAMKTVGEEFPSLSGFYPRPKPVLVSWILSVQQLSGIYAPFTIEANYNSAMTDYHIPHTICHELSHLKGFMREDEANFIGYLACISSDDPAFQYSGYLTGFVYAGNALAKVNREAYYEIYQQLVEPVREDLRQNNEFWAKYEGRVAEVSTQWNDTYLKMNRQTDGVRSYGRMVDLMLAYDKK